MDHVGAVERPVMEYSFPAADGMIPGIALPAVQAKNFEIKPSIIQIIRSRMQFLVCLKRTLISISLIVTLANRATTDAAAGGTIMKKFSSEAFNIVNGIVINLYSYGLERTDKRVADVHSIDAITTLSAQKAALTHKVDNLRAVIWNGAPIGRCGACGQMGQLSQDCKMPGYAKFLKEVISNKRKWEGGASVNLMSYSIFEKLEMHEPTPTIITLRLADRSIKYPREIVEDVLDMKEKHKEAIHFVDTGHEPNKKKRWMNQTYESGGSYMEHSKARDESYMRRKKFKDGDKRPAAQPPSPSSPSRRTVVVASASSFIGNFHYCLVFARCCAAGVRTMLLLLLRLPLRVIVACGLALSPPRLLLYWSRRRRHWPTPCLPTPLLCSSTSPMADAATSALSSRSQRRRC
ncbi:UNVERIFIED_CONTAM: hypothetical protein Sradi_4017700 [Sesamum radiatum]|uniref:CCHC-type domain-containing protein n=1 Tax=Sesamum radiatum TaxID=300843 RepID=A0AAW2PIY8_SESRA